MKNFLLFIYGILLVAVFITHENSPGEDKNDSSSLFTNSHIFRDDSKKEEKVKKEILLIPFCQGNEWGYKDEKGNIKIPCQFDFAEKFSEGLALVATGNEFQRRISYIDSSGKVVISTTSSFGKSFSQGLAALRLATGWGYINRRGEVVIPGQFEEASAFKNGKAEVKKDGKVFWIDLAGKKTHK